MVLSTEMLEETVVCTKCCVPKPITAFTKHHKSKTGHMSVCTDCFVTSVNANHTPESLEETRARRRQWDRERQRAKRASERARRAIPAESRELGIVLRVEPIAVSDHGMCRVLVQTIASGQVWCRVSTELWYSDVIVGDFCRVTRYKNDGKFTIPRIGPASVIIDRVLGVKPAAVLIDMLSDYLNVKFPESMKAVNQKSWRGPIRKNQNA